MDRNKDKDLSRFDEMLSRYMKGKMSADEEGVFKQMLNDNETFCNKAISTARLVQAMNEVGNDLDDKIIDSIRDLSLSDTKKIAANACDSATDKHRSMTLRNFVISFSAAVSILLCIFGGYRYYKYYQVTSLGSEYLTYFPVSEFSRGESEDVNNTLKGLYSDIETKSNLDTAISELKVMWDESRKDSYNDYTEYMPEIGWLLSNAYLRNNDKSQALEVLDVLINEYPKGCAMGDKARELKIKIEEIKFLNVAY